MSKQIVKVHPKDRRAQIAIDQLLQTEGIRRDANLDYSCAIFTDDNQAIATGSCFGNTLRCLAVSSAHQGEGLMNSIMTHLHEMQLARGNSHLFLYTKYSAAKFFADLGFYNIAAIPDKIVFMENQRTGFDDYLRALQQADNTYTRSAALVMNANPFTLGHQYLVEKAASAVDILHLFIVSEDTSLVPFAVRKHLVKKGTAHLNNILYHETGPYIISNATFPSYFQKEANDIIESQALLDLTVFIKIAKSLGINQRYVGEEPTSVVTALYNQIMQTQLPKAGIACHVIPRKTYQDSVISASIVRKAIQDNQLELLPALVPTTTLDYLLSEEAQPVIKTIQTATNVIHH